MIIDTDNLFCEGCPALGLRDKKWIKHCESLREKQIDSTFLVGMFLLCESIPKKRFVYDLKTDYNNDGLRYNLRRELVNGENDIDLLQYLRDNFVLIIDCAFCPLYKLESKKDRRLAATLCLERHNHKYLDLNPSAPIITIFPKKVGFLKRKLPDLATRVKHSFRFNDVRGLKKEIEKHKNDTEEELLETLNELLPRNKQIPKKYAKKLLEFMLVLDGIFQTPQDKRNEDLNLAKELISAAKQDLIASKLLFDSNDKANSIYHLQQATEKIAKAYGLSFFALDKTDLKKIGHRTPNVFIELFNEEWVNPYLKLIQFTNPNFKNDVDVKKFRSIVKTKQVEIGKLNADGIEPILRLNRRLKEKLGGKQFSDKTKKKIKPTLKIVLYDSLQNKKIVDRIMKEVVDVFFDSVFVKTFSSFSILYLISVVTYPHFEYPRYPDGEIKPDEYNNLGVTKYYSEISEGLEEITTCLEEYIKSIIDCRNKLDSILDEEE